jgi:hypothetical protein
MKGAFLHIGFLYSMDEIEYNKPHPGSGCQGIGDRMAISKE